MPLFNYPYDNTQVTVELREIVESGVNIWDFDYPTFYTGDAKTAFEKKVIDHYYFRQIGQETVGRWLHYFRARMREIMPYYIQLYGTVKIMEALPNPFDNVDVTETYTEERTGTTSGTTTNEAQTNRTGKTTTEATSSTENTGTSSGEDKTTATHTEEHTRKFSNTPQGSISNLDSYLTEANVETADDGDTQTVNSSANTSASSEGTASGEENVTGEETTSGTQTDSGTQTEHIEHTYTKKGNQGVNTYAHDMLEYRQTLINIDMQIINELKDLFLMVY